MLGSVAPARWPPSQADRARILAAAVAGGDRRAAGIVLAEAALDPAARRPRTASAILRAAALDALAADRDPAEAEVSRTVASYLRGAFSPRPRRATDAGFAADEARLRAELLRGEGHQTPIVAATFPGFDPNPYGRLMETAYASNGLAAVHVDSMAAIDAIVAGAGSGYRAVVHVNAPDRLIARVGGSGDVAQAADTAIGRLDAWLAEGATIVTSVHNDARLLDERAPAERAVAQAVADRAAIIHVLTASTPRLLGDWIRLDPERLLHVPHPSYDGAYAEPPPADEARSRLGIASDELVVGLIGTLTDRKAPGSVVEALSSVPERLPDGRRLRLLLGGTLVGGSSEDLIRAALAERRVIARFGFIHDDDIPTLLAALDVAIVPYGHYLNSGWLHLALTFGIPVVAPAGGTAPEIAKPAAIRVFGDGATSLPEALTHAGELATPAARAAARASVQGLDASTLSTRLAVALRAAVDR